MTIPRCYEPYRAIDTLSPAAQALIAYIRTNDYVTYAEMPRILAPFLETKGPLAAILRDAPTVVMWIGMSEEWMNTLNELFAAEVLWRQPCTVLNYFIDGAALQMPLAKRPPKGGYATPHWAPVCFRPIEHVDPKERKRYGPQPPAHNRCGRERANSRAETPMSGKQPPC